MTKFLYYLSAMLAVIVYYLSLVQFANGNAEALRSMSQSGIVTVIMYVTKPLG